MAKPSLTLTLGELAQRLQGELRGPADLPISNLAPAGQGTPTDLTFADAPRYLRLAEESEVGAVLLRPTLETTKPAIAVDSPRAAFGMLLHLYDLGKPAPEGIHPTAVISAEAQVEPRARIGAYAVIEAGATIAADAQVFPHAYIGERCHVGKGCIIYPHAVLLRDVHLGTGVMVHSGVVLGADGFGFAWTGSAQAKIPQIGRVAVGDSVEIGANTCVDRATCGETVIGPGVKLDNMVQIGHNVRIGEHTVIAGQTAVGGSSVIDPRVTVGGHVSISDHVHVKGPASIGGRSGVMGDVTEPGDYFGLPLMPAREALRTMALTKRLPELLKRIETLERELAQFRQERDELDD